MNIYVISIEFELC